MARYRLSRLSELDLLEIGLYTLRTWGQAQTDRYLFKIEQFAYSTSVYCLRGMT